jgi:citrate lyase subunit beta / citryl-CoA lyase
MAGRGNGMSRRRSWLYVPAHDRRKIERAATSNADVVILDLEDGTPASSKAAGRECVVRALAEVDFGHSLLFVRLNGVSTIHWRADIEATLASDELDGYVLAKASGPDHVRAVADAVRETLDGERTLELAPILTEDVNGVFASSATQVADPMVRCVLWGSEDLSADLGAWAVKDADGRFLDVFRTVRSIILLQAARVGRAAIDTPFLGLDYSDGLHAEAREAAIMGFAGKQAIHPRQVETINDAFTPGEQELERAREVVAAFEDGRAVARVQGTMADSPHVIRARKLLAMVADTRTAVDD